MSVRTVFSRVLAIGLFSSFASVSFAQVAPVVGIGKQTTDESRPREVAPLPREKTGTNPFAALHDSYLQYYNDSQFLEQYSKQEFGGPVVVPAGGGASHPPVVPPPPHCTFDCQMVPVPVVPGHSPVGPVVPGAYGYGVPVIPGCTGMPGEWVQNQDIYTWQLATPPVALRGNGQNCCYPLVGVTTIRWDESSKGWWVETVRVPQPRKEAVEALSHFAPPMEGPPTFTAVPASAPCCGACPKADKLAGTWVRELPGVVIAATLTGEELKIRFTQSIDGVTASITLTADCTVTREGLMYGVITGVDVDVPQDADAPIHDMLEGPGALVLQSLADCPFSCRTRLTSVGLMVSHLKFAIMEGNDIQQFLALGGMYKQSKDGSVPSPKPLKTKAAAQEGTDALAGGAVGTGAGAVIGAVEHAPVQGAVIGGLVGASTDATSPVIPMMSPLVSPMAAPSAMPLPAIPRATVAVPESTPPPMLPPTLPPTPPVPQEESRTPQSNPPNCKQDRIVVTVPVCGPLQLAVDFAAPVKPVAVCELDQPERKISLHECIGIALEKSDHACPQQKCGVAHFELLPNETKTPSVQINYLLANVEVAYWNLYAANHNLSAYEKALRTAYQGYRLTDTRATVGCDSPEVKDQSRAQFERFRRMVIDARGTVQDAERQLRGLLGMRVDDGTRLVPSDEPNLALGNPDFKEAAQEAMAHRPEIIQRRQALKTEELNVILQKNLSRPDLRFITGYSITGLGTRIVPPSATTSPVPQNAPAQLAANQYQNWTDGLRLTVPLECNDANPAVRAAQLSLARSYYQLRDTEQKVFEFLVHQYRQVVQTRADIDPARAELQALQTHLAKLNTLLGNGKGDSKDVLNYLTIQQQAATAAATYHQAIATYKSAQAVFEFAKGTIQKYHGIALQDGPVAAVVPRELDRVALPPYVVEAPDVLHIEVVKRTKMPVQGLINAFATVEENLPVQSVTGSYLVRPDGSVSLGHWGTVKVSGLTTEQVADAIGKHLLQNPELKELATCPENLTVKVDVAANNSKCFYVIFDGSNESIYRFPCTGSDTVLDAIAKVHGLIEEAANIKVLVARRSPNPGEAWQTLPVDCVGIIQHGICATNYALLSGDRVYVKVRHVNPVVVPTTASAPPRQTVSVPPPAGYVLPPDEARYNLPDTAPYQKPSQQKEKDTMMVVPSTSPTPMTPPMLPPPPPAPPFNGAGFEMRWTPAPRPVPTPELDMIANAFREMFTARDNPRAIQVQVTPASGAAGMTLPSPGYLQHSPQYIAPDSCAAGMTLPSPRYLQHTPQYFAPDSVVAVDANSPPAPPACCQTRATAPMPPCCASTTATRNGPVGKWVRAVGPAVYVVAIEADHLTITATAAAKDEEGQVMTTEVIVTADYHLMRDGTTVLGLITSVDVHLDYDGATDNEFGMLTAALGEIQKAVTDKPFAMSLRVYGDTLVLGNLRFPSVQDSELLRQVYAPATDNSSPWGAMFALGGRYTLAGDKPVPKPKAVKMTPSMPAPVPVPAPAYGFPGADYPGGFIPPAMTPCVPAGYPQNVMPGSCPFAPPLPPNSILPRVGRP